MTYKKLTSNNKYVNQQITLIDQRPLRWYVALRKLDRDIAELLYRREYMQKDVQELRDLLTKFSAGSKVTDKKVEFATLERRYNNEFDKLRSLDQELSEIIFARKQVIAEISSGGYIVEGKDNTVVIYQPQPPADAAAPLDIDAIKALTNELWIELSTKLENALFKDNKLITSPYKINDFNNSKAQLVDVSSCQKIQNHLTELRANIDAIDVQIKNIKADSDVFINTITDNTAKAIAGSVNLYNERKSIYDTAYNWVKASYPQIPENDPYGRFTKLMRLKVRALGWGLKLEDLINQMNQYATEISTAIQGRDNAINNHKASVTAKLKECDDQRTLASKELESYDANKEQALLEERINFLLYWNNPQIYEAKVDRTKIDPDQDPLQTYYNNFNQNNPGRQSSYKIHNFHFKGNGYYDQDDRRLEDFMQQPHLGSKVITLPCLDQNGQISSEMLQAIIGPRRPNRQAKHTLPDVKIVETHNLSVSWRRFALGPLANTVNLAPGEKKQIVVKTQTSVTRKLEQSSSSSTETQRNVTSSFEDNLTNELSRSVNKSNSDTNTSASKQDQSTTNRSGSQTDQSKNQNSSAGAKAKGSFFGNLFSVSGEASTASANAQKSSQSQSMEAAIAVSQSQSIQTLSNESRALSAKNTENRIQRVATETSTNNKVQVTSSSSESYEQDTTNKEIKDLHNPNEGRAINYNLYQLQNVYDVNITLKDVKLVVNTGWEIVEGSGIFETRTFELEEFNKIFKSTRKTDQEILLCAFIARKVIKNYTDILHSPAVNKGILRIALKPGENLQKLLAELIIIAKKLNLNLPPAVPAEGKADDGSNLKAKILELRGLLLQLQGYSFALTDKHLVHHSEYVVNAPSYHMDTQLGLRPATEQYLEDQRVLALQEHKNFNELILAEADHLRNSNSSKPPSTEPSPPPPSQTSKFRFTFLPVPKPLPEITPPPSATIEVKNSGPRT